MAYYGALEVIDRAGWAKTFPLEKALLMIGSADFNDIVLPEERGLGVAPAHLQVMRPAVETGSIRLVNLSAAPVSLIKNGLPGASLPGGGTAELEDGDGLLLAEFRLTFAIQSQGGVVRSARSEHLGLKIELPGPALRPFKQLAGRLTLTNYGSQPRCQFELELEGLPADCYRIDPAPMLFPHGEGQAQIRFIHRGSRPPGGLQALLLRATAPGAYPTEEVALEWNLEVAPAPSVQLALDEDPVAPWQREAGARSQSAIGDYPSAPAAVLAAAAALAASPAPVAPPLAAAAPADEGYPDGAAGHDADEAPPAVALAIAPALPPPTDTEWWGADSPTGAGAPTGHIGATRRPRLRLNGRDIPVLRAAPEPMPGADGTTGPSAETGEEARP